MSAISARSSAPDGGQDGFAAWLVRDREDRRKGERTRIDLLVAGAELLAIAPLDRLTVAALCKAAGVAHGTFYLYFSDRNALAGALLSAFVDHVQGRMRAAARSPGDAARNTTAAYMDLFEKNPGLMKCLVVGLDAFPEARAAFQRLNHEWVLTVVRATQRRAGDAARPEDDLMRRAYALGGMVDQYLAAIYLYEDRHVVATAGSIKEVVATLTAIWCRAFADILPTADMGPAAR